MSRSPLFLAAFSLLLASPAAAGPPWIAIEYPANPHHASTRGAALLVRAYHHSTALNVPVRGTAEGLVDGRRVTRALDLQPTSIAGVYALRGALPKGDTWVLAISIEQAKDDAATALVTLDGKGGIARIEVPSRTSRDGWTVPLPVKAADIDRALQLAAAERAGGVRHAGGAAGSTGTALAGVLGLPVLIGLLARRRRRLPR